MTLRNPREDIGDSNIGSAKPRGDRKYDQKRILQDIRAAIGNLQVMLKNLESAPS